MLPPYPKEMDVDMFEGEEELRGSEHMRMSANLTDNQ